MYSLMQSVASTKEAQNIMADRRENTFYGSDLGCRGQYSQRILGSKHHDRKRRLLVSA